MRTVIIVLGLLLSTVAWALKSSEYLPADADLDPAIPAPESVLGWDVGEWRASHDQIVKYLEVLAASSDRASISTIGYSHEQRPILQLVFTSPGNHGQLEVLRAQHLRSAHVAIDRDSPLVVWLGHSIHGNEESGSNGAMLSAYYLAASRSDFVTGLLDEAIILLDPAFNPDGLNRFASWSNANRSKNPVADRNHRIHNEAWPSARTNHYLFDINRDWLPLVHPESRARVAEFHRWLPNVLTDQHERSRDGYFFQPGIPSRQNPLIPVENFQITSELAQYHASAMDRAGEIYFTEDDFDDFYFGKGSTYPDINGGIGILFEQPNIRGPVLERDTGRYTFADAIRNHLRTTISTLRGSFELRDQLKVYQRGFFKSMSSRAREAGFAAWIVGDDGDPARAAAFLSLLGRHRIEYSPLAQDVSTGGIDFKAGHAWVMPVQQRQFGMLQAIMETRTEFADDTFYDVSAWTQPLAWNLPYTQLNRMPQTGQNEPDEISASISRDAVAWVISWSQMQAPALLQKLLDAGARVRAATKPFTVTAGSGPRSFSEGALVVHAGLQDAGKAEVAFEVLSEAADAGIRIVGTSTALTPSGPDLGALHFKLIRPVKPLMLVGTGTSEYGVGYAWHHFDQRLGIVPVMVEIHRLGEVRISDYTRLVMADGNYSAIGTNQKERIGLWINEGGILVTADRASNWAESLCFAVPQKDCEKEDDGENETPVESRPYGQFKNDEGRQIIGGAIVATTADTTHPLTYGLARTDLPLFRHGTTLLKASDNAYSTPVRYTSDPLMAGFIGPEQLDNIRSQPALIAERRGAGLVVRFANNPLFRGFWRGTERLFDNALYMGQTVEDTDLPD
jgi:hypothetical protein